MVIGVLAVVGVVSVFGAPMYYLQVLGNGILAQQDALNPFNPAGVQFTSNFVQMELRDVMAGAAPGVTDPTGSANVMFAFPIVASYRVNDLVGFRVELFTPADRVALLNSLLTFWFSSPHAVAMTPRSVLGITYAVRLGNMGIGLRYVPEFDAHGTYKVDNYSAGYFKNKIEPGFVMNLGGLTINAVGQVHLTFFGANEAATNGAYTNSMNLKSPLERLGLMAQASYRLSDTILVGARLDGRMLNNGLDRRGSTVTNSFDFTTIRADATLSAKLSPVQLIDAYIDLGTRFYTHNALAIVSGAANSTNTNTVSQIALPSLALGVNVKPGNFRFKLGLAQDIIATSSPITCLADVYLPLNAEHALDSSVTGMLDGNTVYSMRRTASAGFAYVRDSLILEATLDISTTSFLGSVAENPLEILSWVFNSAAGAPPRLFTGIRVGFVF